MEDKILFKQVGFLSLWRVHYSIPPLNHNFTLLNKQNERFNSEYRLLLIWDLDKEYNLELCKLILRKILVIRSTIDSTFLVNFVVGWSHDIKGLLSWIKTIGFLVKYLNSLVLCCYAIHLIVFCVNIRALCKIHYRI